MLTIWSRHVFAAGAKRALATAAVALAAGCVPKNTEAILDRQAARFDEEFAARTASALQDQSWLVSRDDALAAAVSAVGVATKVDDRSVSSDWAFSGTVTVDHGGERLDLNRERVEVVIYPEAEIQLSVTRISGTRTYTSTGAGDWSESTGPAAVPEGLMAELQRLERANLHSVRTSHPAEFLEDLRTHLPAGFALVAGPVDAVIAERLTEHPRKKAPYGTWRRRETLRAAVVGDQVRITSALAYAFDAPGWPGDWHERSSVAQDAADDWVAGGLRRAVAEGRADLVTHLPPPVPLDRPFSEPPPVPRMRAMDEIREVVSRRAYATQTGRFRVCLNHVLVNPRSPGGDWDLPGAAETLGLVERVAGATARGAGDLNALFDAVPALGEVADARLMAYTGGIDRHQLEEIARLTEGLAGWTREELPVKPDVQGRATVAGQTFPIPMQENQLHLRPGLCAIGDFRGGGMAARVQLIDVDLQEHDSIGSCEVSLLEALAQVNSGSRCGQARVFLSAEFLFTPDQIAVIGLPPP